MRVAVVGCGMQGATLAGLLGRDSCVSGLTLIARDQTVASDLRDALAACGVLVPIDSEVADALDCAAVTSVIRNADVVVNATLPGANLSVMRAALAAGAHYFDFGMGGTPTEESCSDLDEEFLRADLLAVCNTGASPGLTDLLARSLSREMTSVETITARWADRTSGRELVLPFAPVLVFKILLPHPVVNQQRQMVEVDLFESRETFTWPSPIGDMEMFTASHMSDVWSIGLAVPNAGQVEVKSGLAIGRWQTWPEVWGEVLRRCCAYPEFRTEPLEAVVKAVIPAPLDFRSQSSTAGPDTGGFGVSVTVKGRDAAGSVVRTCSVVTNLAEARRQLPFATAMSHLTAGSSTLELIKALGRAEIPDRGVLPSVGCLSNAEELTHRLLNREFSVSQEVSRISTEGRLKCPETSAPSRSASSSS